MRSFSSAQEIFFLTEVASKKGMTALYRYFRWSQFFKSIYFAIIFVTLFSDACKFERRTHLPTVAHADGISMILILLGQTARYEKKGDLCYQLVGSLYSTDTFCSIT
jgi:hypothetical protein